MSWLRELPRMGQRLWRSRQNKAQGKRSEGPRSPGYKSQIISEALKERQKNPLEQPLFCRPLGALCYSFHLFPGLRGLLRPLTPGFDLQPWRAVYLQVLQQLLFLLPLGLQKTFTFFMRYLYKHNSSKNNSAADKTYSQFFHNYDHCFCVSKSFLSALIGARFAKQNFSRRLK